MLERLRRVWKVIWGAAMAFVEDEALTHGAAIAFYTVLSMAPILVLLIWLSSALGPNMQDQLIEQVAGLVGRQGGEVIGMIMQNADRDPDTAHVAGWMSIGAILVSATAVFAQLQVALNAIWAVKPRTKGLGIAAWLRKRLMSLGLILSFGFLMLVSLVVSSALSAVMHRVESALPGAAAVWRVGDFVVPFLVYLVMFMALFRFVPDAELGWRHVAFGGVVTAALFVLGKWLIGLYLGTSALASSYGAAGSLILTLLWAYYSAAIVLFGAELTQVHVRAHGERIRIESIAEPAQEQEQHTPRPTETGRPAGTSVAERRPWSPRP